MLTSDQPGGERSISTAGNVSGIANTGDNPVIVQINGVASAESVLAELVARLEREVRVERRPVDEELAKKADQLANRVLPRLRDEVEQLRLRDRASLPVHWRPAFGRAPGGGEDTRNAPSGAAGGPLLSLAGQLAEITAKSRWLMVLGREGSGKSVLALQFALNRLEARSHDRKGPVPVVFSLGSWNLDTVSLRKWLIGRLERDQPFLAEVGPIGTTWAEALVDADYVLPILDGFDEIVVRLRTKALNQLNSSTRPLVVTSRRDAIEDVMENSNVAPSAAAIELVDLSLDESVKYLHEVTGASPADATDISAKHGWTYVLGELSRRPHTRASANLASVLTTPLMATLARFAYESELSSRDPSDLLNTEKFDTQDALEKHLLDFFIRTAYERILDNKPAEGEGGGEEDRRWDEERARHWLGYLAVHLTKRGTPDIEWWQLGTAMKLRWRMLQVGVTVGIASGLVAGLVYGAEEALVYGPTYGLMVAGLTGLANGAGVGLTFGLMHGFVTKMKAGGPTFEPSRMEIRLHSWTEEGTGAGLRKSFRPRVMGGLAGGLLFGLLWALGGAALSALRGSPWPVIGRLAGVLLMGGTGLGLVLGLIAALGAGFETVIKREELVVPSLLLDTSRATVLKQIITVGLVIWAGYGAVFGLMSNSAFAGLGAGLVAGSMVALGVGTMTAWGRWVVLAQIWLPLAGRLPRDLNAFLQDSYARGVLRREGAVYQFRHARLKEHLSDAYQN
ncbi:NACHT domain-containing protein [Streptomyces sp. NPDC054834]